MILGQRNKQSVRQSKCFDRNVHRSKLHHWHVPWNPDVLPLPQQRVTHLVSSIVIGLLVVYAGLLLMLWRFQDRILFQPPVGVASSAVEARHIQYRAADGVELFAYLVGDCTRESTLVIAFHGNAEIARWSVPWAATLVRESNVCVLLPEYRGYDGLSGVPTYETSAHDARAALR